MQKYTTKYFVQKSKEIHGNKYDYSLAECNNNLDKVKIICHYHGEFIISARHHINSKRGCKFCTKTHDNKDSFVEKSKEKHGNKYDYSLVMYVNAHTSVDIICPKHDVFQQMPMNHSKGNGCKKCADENLTGLYCDSFFGKNPNKKICPARLYLIEVIRKKSNEHFLKLGITTTALKERWKSRHSIVLLDKELSLYKAYCVEQDLLNTLNKYRYIPKDITMRFRGKNECFDITHRNKIIDIITKHLDHMNDTNKGKLKN